MAFCRPAHNRILDVLQLSYHPFNIASRFIVAEVNVFILKKSVHFFVDIDADTFFWYQIV
jgi:hypothetical protein